MLKKSLKIPKR